MSTRYYILTKDKEFVDKYFPAKTNAYYITDEPYLSYEIPIGDRSSGWKPLFRTHKHAYNSVKEMKKFLSEHLDKIEIYNSYNEKLDFQTLNDEKMQCLYIHSYQILASRFPPFYPASQHPYESPDFVAYLKNVQRYKCQVLLRHIA